MNNKIEMKMKKNQLTMLVLFVTMLGFTACSDDDKVSISTVGITTTVDTTIEGLQLTGVWGIERSGFFNGREKWAKGFENQRV